MIPPFREAAPGLPAARDPTIVRVARDLEATFLATMLKEAGVGAPRGAFGGGSGEQQFASFLTDIYARKLADAGGIGLAEPLVRALSERPGG